MRVTLYRDHPDEGWRGMERYAESLKAALQQTTPPEWEIEMPMPPTPWPGTYRRILARLLWYPLWARCQQGDLNHVIDHSYGHLLFTLDPERTILTTHDVAPFRFPGRRLGVSGLAWKLAWQGVKRARHIIVVSSFTATELQKYLGLPAERFCVVHQGVSPDFHPHTQAESAAIRQRFLREGERMLLHVGHTQPRKNLPTLLQALALLRQQGIQGILVQIGGQADASQKQLVQELELEQVVHFVGYVPDQDLATFYSAADVFVFPSLYEGFGMPVLEAMACGTPVVASNAASLPEVVGDAALTVDPRDAEGLAEAIERVLSDLALAAELRQRGLVRAGRFTWERTAQATLEVYCKILEKTR